MTDEITITRASVDDAPEVLALIRRTFAAAARLYEDPDLPPLIETLEDHRARYDTFVVLKATDADGVIVGSVQGRITEDRVCHVARLAVDPARQGCGIGRALALALEAEFAEARRFELFTGQLNTASLSLYASLGYTETRRERVDDRLTLVWLEKSLPET